MNSSVLLLGFAPMLWVLVPVLLFLFFGASALPKFARALGESKRALRQGLSGKEAHKD